MDCPSCGKAMRLTQQVNVNARFVDIDPEDGGGEKIEVDDQHNRKFWKCRPCKVSRPVE